MSRIATCFGVDSGNFFVLSNGIFTTGRSSGKISKAGLAKHSWVVAKALIASRSGNVKAGLARGGTVRGYVREIVTGPNQRVEALLENNLKYIAAATPEGVVDEAMRAATRTIDGIIKDALEKAGGKI